MICCCICFIYIYLENKEKNCWNSGNRTIFSVPFRLFFFFFFFFFFFPQKIDLLDSKGHIYRHRGSCLDGILRANIYILYILPPFFFFIHWSFCFQVVFPRCFFFVFLYISLLFLFIFIQLLFIFYLNTSFSLSFSLIFSCTVSFPLCFYC